MSTHKSLDELLKEIQEESSHFPEISSAGGTGATRPVSAGMAHISAHVAPAPVATPQPDERAGATEIWENNLSPRQRVLPKLDLRVLGGMVAVFVLALGIGSTTMLVQQSQDLRQMAYEQTLPELEGPSATEKVRDHDAGMEQAATLEEIVDKHESVTQRLTFLGAVILGLGAFGLVAFLAWLFFA
ncbi:hypothetical protein LRY60_00435 [Candidatus Woesebacteria bacterium]|nr:hypothetical protein [Candidatus Woesebacteria bacterium]